jgi:hypothetical protein
MDPIIREVFVGRTPRSGSVMSHQDWPPEVWGSASPQERQRT